MSQTDPLQTVRESISESDNRIDPAVQIPKEGLELVKSEMFCRCMDDSKPDDYLGWLNTGMGKVHLFYNPDLDTAEPKLPVWQQS